MASPQREHGYTAIANEIMDALAKYRVPGEKRQVLDYILRNTYGYNRKQVRVSYSEIAKGTSLHRQAVKKAMKWLMGNLVLKKVPVGTQNGTRTKQIFEFNKNYDEWEQVKKKISGPNNGTSSVVNNGTRSQIAPIIVKTKKKSDDFIFFWEIYPNKKNKKGAKKIWDRLVKNKELPPIEDILTAVKDQIAEKEYLKSQNKFCPDWKHPTTWLNNGCWDDVVQKPDSALPGYIYSAK